ncbi:Reticulocyte-binding protein 2-like protein a [Colletotrichum trifolii]|uniref:Reticulocyte-binding protein 2-like protein a n=1 Tax=Colletotrichum trifolii TaxID=5466 RepID=A0A4R8RQQ5_COLTR|nr:Reticulocyte-binding protein 2-like protein a [Colletotrichum trifolii]
MSGYHYDGSSSAAAPPPPPPPYSISDSGFGDPASTSSSLHPPPPGLPYGTSGSVGSPPASWNGSGILDSKWRLADPRSSSSQSLAPSEGDRDGDARRTLLIVYIHGFYGNESSFRSFPAHVHNHLKEALADTHSVHSKIYPRYKTYKAIDVARDNFSQWLEPHESDSTDVVLVGHSMGGLLAGEVALMPNRHPYRRHPFKHRILGTISLDSPFLGLHPGIIVAGISSLFRPASPQEEEHDQMDASAAHISPNGSAMTSPNPSMPNLSQASSLGAELSPTPSNSASLASSTGLQSSDPYFNAPFFNDINLKDRPFMRRLGHFAKKHSREGIWDATKNHVMSHLEYGGCLADYPGLNNRYNKLRALESVDPLEHLRGGDEKPSNFNRPQTARVRFVNYYTLSTGRPKKPKTPDSPKSPAEEIATLDAIPQRSPPLSSTPRISVEDSDEGEQKEIMASIEVVDRKLTDIREEQKTKADVEARADESSPSHQPEPKGKEKQELQWLEPMEYIEPTEPPAEETPQTQDQPTEEATPAATPSEPELPPIPDLPEPPSPPDLEKYTDKDARKQAEKEAKRAQKAYDNAVKGREKAIKERQKLVEKRRKKAEKELQRMEAEEQKRKQKEKKQQAEAEAKQRKTEDDETLKEIERLRVQEAAEDDQGEPEPKLSAHELAERRRLAEEAERMDREARRLAGKPVDETPPTTTKETTPPVPTRPAPPPLPPRNASSADTSSAPQQQQQQQQSKGKVPAAAAAETSKPKKERKFCTLPRKINGRRDETWVSVFMDGMDEVGAHCGLFVPGPHYDRLIGDVSERIVGWVQEDLSTRAIMDMS